MRRILGVLTASFILLAAAPGSFGGWAVITVEELPSRLVVGEAYHLAFTVRQHGRDPMRRLAPTVTLRYEAGGEETVQAERGPRNGMYVATITAREPGPVRIAVDTHWMEARIALLPIAAVAPGVTPAVTEGASHGRALFVAKGCVTCHTKRDDPVVQERHYYAAGPELGGRTWPAEWLAAKLRDPACARVASPNGMGMPDLDLRGPEITALVAYLNRAASGTQVGASR